MGCSASVPTDPLELWFYCQTNLAVDGNVERLNALIARASQAGYTHLLLSDSKFAKLGDMGPPYFGNVERVKTAAREAGIEVVPAVFPIGYSNDLLWHDPDLVEALPVRDALFIVRKGAARLEADPSVELRGGDFADLDAWDWHDATVAAEDGAACMRDPRGRNARIVQTVRVAPFRQYHVSVRIRTEDFRGTPEVLVLAKGRRLDFTSLGAMATQAWTTHHVVFNSLGNDEATVYFGCWNGSTGALWFDDARFEEVGLVNLVRRDGAPLTVRVDDGEVLVEGRDCEPVVDPLMGTHPWKGCYDVYHEPPVIGTSLADGTRLRVSYYHATTAHRGQAMICPSEPRTADLLRDQARRMHELWQAGGYMMSHDEIRVLNWCEACRRRNLDAGEIVADNVRTCIRILREVNPGGRIYVWSDMFDPHHNAREGYYLVRGNLRGSWEGLDPEVIVVPWYFKTRSQSLRWFAGRGHRQVMAAYYDGKPEQAAEWLRAARGVPGVRGIMYTTWQDRYDDLEAFAAVVRSGR